MHYLIQHNHNNSYGGERLAILEVNGLSIAFTQYNKGLKQKNIQAVKNFSIELNEGEILAVVGSSGSGKSLLAHAILGLLPANAQMNGEIVYQNDRLTSKRQAKLRGKEIVLIPQSTNYLDPLMKVGKQVQLSGIDKNKRKIRQKHLFKQYDLAKKVENMFPFELSGGMARRVLLSMSTMNKPKVIIADEPTPGLDEKIMREALNQFRQLKELGCAIMFITHDIEAALQIADRVAVFYAGTTVEIANVSDFTGKGENLRHPYTKALWNALPQNGFIPIIGSQPALGEKITGCPFKDRCHLKTSECEERLPELQSIRDGEVRCFHAD